MAIVNRSGRQRSNRRRSSGGGRDVVGGALAVGRQGAAFWQRRGACLQHTWHRVKGTAADAQKATGPHAPSAGQALGASYAAQHVGEEAAAGRVCKGTGPKSQHASRWAHTWAGGHETRVQLLRNELLKGAFQCLHKEGFGAPDDAPAPIALKALVAHGKEFDSLPRLRARGRQR